jgi:hypothetical protein
MVSFGKLLRFKNPSGNIFYGEAKDLPNVTKDGLIGATVPIFEGGEPWDPNFTPTGQTETVAEV